MRIWRRPKPAAAPPPVVLPSLDRLAGLIERVVELVDEVSGAPSTAPRQAEQRRDPQRQPQPEPRPALPAPSTDGDGWLAFVPSPHGYELLGRDGSLPPPGEELDLNGTRYRVLRHAPSPLPGDGRRVAVIEMEEPPAPDRSFDA